MSHDKICPPQPMQYMYLGTHFKKWTENYGYLEPKKESPERKKSANTGSKPPGALFLKPRTKAPKFFCEYTLLNRLYPSPSESGSTDPIN